jgi:hypothetical protein
LCVCRAALLLQICAAPAVVLRGSAQQGLQGLADAGVRYAFNANEAAAESEKQVFPAATLLQPCFTCCNST